jgi:hypothetical protein
MEVSLSHTILPIAMEGGTTTHKCRERHIGIIPQQEPCFSLPDRKVRQPNRTVGNNIRPRAD